MIAIVMLNVLLERLMAAKGVFLSSSSEFLKIELHHARTI